MRRRSSSIPAEPRVTCEELADALGWTTGAVISKLARLRVQVGPDWADRPSITVPDAARAYERMVGDVRSDSDAWKAYQSYVETRAQQLQEAISQAAAEARRGSVGDPLRESQASKAAADALERFEAEHPLLGFEEFRPGGDGA